MRWSARNDRIRVHRMTAARRGALVLLALRIAYGVALVVAPARLGRRWLGSASATAPTQVPLRGLGVREVALHGAALIAAVRGAPLRPWLAVSIAGDLSDIASTVAGRQQLPKGSAVATLAAGGGSAALTAVLAAAVDS
jgi:hypothetical protein